MFGRCNGRFRLRVMGKKCFSHQKEDIIKIFTFAGDQNPYLIRYFEIVFVSISGRVLKIISPSVSNGS